MLFSKKPSVALVPDLWPELWLDHEMPFAGKNLVILAERFLVWEDGSMESPSSA